MGHSCGSCLKENNLGKLCLVSHEEKRSLLGKRNKDFFIFFFLLEREKYRNFHDSERKGTWILSSLLTQTQ